jgi:hypothetical protein
LIFFSTSFFQRQRHRQAFLFHSVSWTLFPVPKVLADLFLFKIFLLSHACSTILDTWCNKVLFDLFCTVYETGYYFQSSEHFYF